MHVCETLLEGSLRDILVKKFWFEVKVQPSYDMKCKESSILKTENFDKNWNFREIFKIFFAVLVQNHEDIVESDNNMWK